MVAALMLPLADVVSTLAAVYWACLIIGGGLLLISAVGALGHDAPDVDAHAGVDFHADAGHADVGSDMHADVGHVDAGSVHAGHFGGAAGLATWFSIRFVVFFLAAFGAIGVILTHIAGARASLCLAAALIGGLVIGQGVHQAFRLIRRSSGDSTPQPQDYVNRLGRVTVHIWHPDPGEVVIQVRGAERFVPAIAAGEVKRFDVGEDVVVVGYRTGVAEVVSKAEFERSRRSS